MAVIVNDKDKILQAASTRIDNYSGDYVDLIVTGQTFRTTSTGTVPSSITITAAGRGILRGLVPSVVVSSGTATLTPQVSDSADTVKYTLSYSNMSTNDITISASIVHFSKTYTTDKIINKVSDVVSISVDRPTIVIYGDNTGTVTDFTNAISNVSVKIGGTDDSANWSYTWSPATDANLTDATGSGISYTGGASKTFTLTGIKTTVNAVTLTCTATKSGQPTQTINVYIVKNVAGTSGYTVNLTNDKLNISTNSDGTANMQYSSYAAGSAQLFIGGTQQTSGVTYSVSPATATNGVTCAIDASGNYTISIPAGTAGNTGTGMTADTVAFTITATYNSIGYTNVFTVQKLKNGAPNTLYWLYTSTSSISYNPNTGLFTSPNIVATSKATVGTSTGSTTSDYTGYYIDYSIDGGADVGSRTQTTRTITTSSISTSAQYITIKMYTASTGGTLVDSEVIPIVAYGINNIKLDLSDDAYPISTNYDGSGNLALTNQAIGTAKLYNGGVVQATGVTYSGTSTVSGVTLTVNATTGAYDLTMAAGGMSTDSISFTITATYNSVAYTNIFTVQKLKNGTPNTRYYLSIPQGSIQYNPNTSTFITTQVVASSYKATGTDAPVSSGYYIDYSVDGGTDAGTRTQDTRTILMSSITGSNTYITVKLYTASTGGTLVDSEVIPIVQNGTNGAAGTNGQRVGVLEVYQWATSAPTSYPSGTSTYTWATGAFTAPTTPNSWSLTPGTPGTGQTLWGISISVSDNLTTSTSTATWNSSTVYAVGGPGSAGANGTRTAVLEMYQWASSAPTTYPSGSSTYTWSTGIFTAPATTNSWTLTPGTPSAGQILYVVRQVYSDSGTTTTSSVTWAATSSYPSGAAGTNGSDGAVGLKTTTGYVYYSLASSTTPTTPSATSFTFSTQAFTSLTANWNTSFTVSASSGGQYWASRYTVTETTSGGNTGTPSFSAPFNWQNFNGLVTFTNSANGASFSSTGGTTFTSIDGNSITTGTIDADAIKANSILTKKMYLGASTGARIELDGSTATKAIKFFNASNVANITLSAPDNGSSGYLGLAGTGLNIPLVINYSNGTMAGLYVYGNSTGGMMTISNSNVLTTSGSYCISATHSGSGTANRGIAIQGYCSNATALTTGLYGWNVSSSALSYGVHGYHTGGGVAILAEATTSTSTNHAFRGKNSSVGSSGLVGSANGYAFYAESTAITTDVTAPSPNSYGPFTGGHDALILSNTEISIGDIVVDLQVLGRLGISETITEVAKSTIPNQKAAVGVLARSAQSLYNTMIPNGLLALTEEQLALLKNNYEYILINAVGEGQVNVCGENGDLEPGDLIVTSSIPGKGMKQSDDIVRSYTVAKCREAVTFTNPTEVKMVACIYLCG